MYEHPILIILSRFRCEPSDICKTNTISVKSKLKVNKKSLGPVGLGLLKETKVLVKFTSKSVVSKYDSSLTPRPYHNLNSSPGGLLGYNLNPDLKHKL